MTGSAKKSKPKAKSAAAKPARPAKAGHKKPAAPRKAALRKAPIKHSSKTNRAPSAVRSDDQYMKFSGKFTVRLPKSLHQALVERAEKEGVSLNLFVTNALSRTVAVPGGKSKR